jgi:hypothetical protein
MTHQQPRPIVTVIHACLSYLFEITGFNQVKGKRVTAFTDAEEDTAGYRSNLPVHEGLGATCNEASTASAASARAFRP